MNEKLREAAQAFVDLYEELDGVVDDLSDRDFRLTQEYYERYLQAKEALEAL